MVVVETLLALTLREKLRYSENHDECRRMDRQDA